MSALSSEQREAILGKYGGLVRTYFNHHELMEARFAYRPRLDPTEVEFHAYLRFASVLFAGRYLPTILKRITLAPSITQERILMGSRGQIEGQLDVSSYVRRRGQLSTPRVFPNWRVHSSHLTPENALAGAAAQSLLSEIQALSIRLPIEGTSESVLVRKITDALQQLLRDPSLAEALQTTLPDICSIESEDLFARVAERWQTRRINNVAYLELWKWADNYRKRGLSDDGILAGLTYSEEFDNRLFEIFCLGALRDSFRDLGFIERAIRPLHERLRAPVLEVEHPDSGLSISVFFQRGEGVLWNEGSPREWPEIAGVPDIGLVPRSSRLPVIIIDAKNRYRGSELEESISEELYKMLGYFQNFPRRMRVQEHGPAGGLIFLSRGDSGAIRNYKSRSGGVLAVTALDPCDTTGKGGVGLLEELLRHSGLLGGRPEVASAIRELKEAVWEMASEGEPAQAEDEVIERIHELVAAQYGVYGPAILQAMQSLELHLLGSSWAKLDDDVRSLLATGEVFWAEHQLAFGMDFAPAVVELCKAMEILLSRMLFTPFSEWAIEEGHQIDASNLTLGQMRAKIEAAKSAASGGIRRPEALLLHHFLDAHELASYTYDELLSELGFVNGLRRRAAHKDLVTGSDAGQLRERMLGVGTASPILARLVVNLTLLKRV